MSSSTQTPPASAAADSARTEESLRDRRARQTRVAIHTAAVHLAHEQGLEEATIARISAEAGISPRTFFNYFASKEDAVIGTPVTGPEVGVVEDAVAAADFSEDLFEATARVIREIMSHTLGDDRTGEMRRVLFLQHPLLVQRKADTGGQMCALLIDVLARTLEDRLASLELPADCTVRDAARMTVLVSFAPLRNTYSMLAEEQSRWLDAGAGDGPSSPGSPPGAHPPPVSAEAAHRRFDHSLDLFHAVMEGSKP